MRKKKIGFDQKFGASFIKSTPLCPGVYQMRNSSNEVIYVGKAKNLRRRLSQYRNAKRCKKHEKMRRILQEAESVSFEACSTDLEALLLENQLIQSLRPRFNVAGAFCFLYPMLGLKHEESSITLIYTTSPELFPGFSFYGAYRSRQLTGDAYFGLTGILDYLGHREPQKRLKHIPKVRYSFAACFRQVPARLSLLLDGFLRGEDRLFLQDAVTSLLDKNAACRDASGVQDHVDSLKRFFKFEAVPLRKVMQRTQQSGRYIAQAERDRLFLRAKHENTKAPTPSLSSEVRSV